MKKILCALILAGSLLLCGCSTFWRGAIAVHDSIDDALAGKTNAVPVPQDPATVTAGEAQVLCDAFPWPQYMDHGYEGENEMRYEGIRKCREAGKTCLGIKLKRMPTPHVAIEILDWESDKERGKFIGRFHKAAEGAGIRAWQVDISSVTDYAGVADLFKHYAAGSVQYVGISLTPEVKTILECDGNGVKTSASRLRK